MVLDHGYDSHTCHHRAPYQLQPQLEPLARRLTGVVCLEAALQHLNVLPDKPRHGLHRPDGCHPGQGLAVVGVYRGHGHRADPLEVPGGGPVPGLDVDIDEGEGEEVGGGLGVKKVRYKNSAGFVTEY